MVVTRAELAEVFYTSNIHQNFNGTVAVLGRQRMDLLEIAAELDAEEFLMRHPDLWYETDPCKLARMLAHDFVERWPMLCFCQADEAADA